MNTFQSKWEHERIINIIRDMTRVNVEDVIPKGFKKYGLNRLRWVLTDFGISHYLLPEMPIMEYVIIASCLEERITSVNLLDIIAFYRILAARNVLKLLKLAYNHNDAVKHFGDLKFEEFLSVIEDDDNMMGAFDIRTLLQLLSLSTSDNLNAIIEAMLENIEPITGLSEQKGHICEVINEGSPKERGILDSYELYHFIFPFCFSLKCPLLYSTERLNKKYKTTKFGNDYDNRFILNIREFRERSGRYEA